MPETPETEDLDLPSKVGAYINACVTISKAVEDIDCLPRSIRVLLPRLTLIQEGLASTSKSLDAEIVSGVYRAALKEVLEQCIVRARRLYEIFKDMAPPAEASKAKKTLKKIRIASKATQIDKCIDEIMKYLQIVPENKAFTTDRKAITEGPAEDSENMEQEVQEDRKGGAKDSPNKESVAQKRNNHNGHGNQNTSMHNSSQVNGSFSGGTFNFHR
ncbi:hypothetical protein MKX08_005755 [Trichoderma sp. CBMAI-0020]|nr:hypothetical protein MKX08_005755 [Trichoderma sp. CBMAI-0020]